MTVVVLLAYSPAKRMLDLSCAEATGSVYVIPFKRAPASKRIGGVSPFR